MIATKPTVVVFFGGPVDTQDLSQETAYWLCNYIPRSTYRVVPVRVTPDNNWQVPLGGLPQQGSVTRMMDMLFQSVRSLSPRQGLERLLKHPLAALMTTIRGRGGDDGALQNLGTTLAVPVVGSSSATCHQASHKEIFAKQIDEIVDTPYSLYFQQSTPNDVIMSEVNDLLEFPVFVKPATTEGSTGVQRVATPEELLPAILAAKVQGDILIQETSPGTEMTVTVVEDAQGKRIILPATLILPRQASFYDTLAKRRAGRVKLHTTTENDRLLKEVRSVVSDVFDELGCRGYASFDLMADKDHGVSLLEANTIPTFTTVTPLPQQLNAAHLHPTQLVDGLLKRALNP